MERLTSRFEFGDFTLDSERRTLARVGVSLPLSARALDLLLELVRSRGTVLSKDVLLERVWPGQFVEENNLTVQVSALRKILGERRNEHPFIVTVPGRGYSFVAPVKELTVSDAEAITLLRDSEDERDPIIGREKELETIKTRLINGAARLLSITGTGGAGKTRLAREIEKKSSLRIPDGIHFVELAELRNPERLDSTLIEQLSIKPEPGVPTRESVFDYFRERRALLVLDNFEQLLSAGANFVESLLEASPKLKILITSRAPLKLNSEVELCIQPLEVPPAGGLGHEKNAIGYPALQLFGLRAKNARPSFEFDDKNIAVCAEICRRLDGLPLSIELAAARVRILSPQSILDRLNDSLGFLTLGSRDLPDRQKTIRDTLRWSHDLLDKDERAVFRRLSVFSGGCTVEDAERLLESEGPFSLKSDRSALDILTALAENNLLTTRDSDDGSTRLGMLEVIREFASDQLDADGEAESTREAHARIFSEFGQRAEPKLLSEDSALWLGRVLREIDNIRAAIEFLLDEDPKSAAKLISSVRYFWINQGQLTEGFNWISKGLAASEGESIDLRFKLNAALGSISRLKGEYSASRYYFQSALDEATAADNIRQIGLAMAGIGTVCQLEGDIASAHLYYERSLAISREQNDGYGIAIGLNCLADLLQKEHNLGKAKILLEEAFNLYEELGNLQAACNNLNIIGQISLEEGQDEEAYSYFSRALGLGERLGNKITISESLNGFAALAVRTGAAGLAANLYGAADALRESIGYSFEPGEIEFRDRYSTQARAQLGDAQFSATYRQGASVRSGDLVNLVGTSLSDLSDVHVDFGSEVSVETHRITRIVIED